MYDYKELIARLRAIGEHLKFDKTSCVYLAADAIERLVKERDANIDAEPVRHGHWIKNNDRDGWNCSICHKDDCYAYLYNYDTDVEDIQDYYCPNCGAKMDEVSE